MVEAWDTVQCRVMYMLFNHIIYAYSYIHYITIFDVISLITLFYSRT